MHTSVQKTLLQSRDFFPGFAPNSPEEKWLKTVQAPRQRGLTGALTPASAAPRQLFESSPLPPRVEDSLPKKEINSPAAAVADTELHDRLAQIEAKKAEIPAATAATPLHQQNSLRSKLQQAPPRQTSPQLSTH